MLIIYFYNNLAKSSNAAAADAWFKKWIVPVAYWNSIFGNAWTIEYFAYIYTMETVYSDATYSGGLITYVHSDPKASG